VAIGSGRNRISGQGKPSVDAMNDESTANGVTAEVVSDYLREHPDFFNQHPHVLGELKISHVGDGAALNIGVGCTRKAIDRPGK